MYTNNVARNAHLPDRPPFHTKAPDEEAIGDAYIIAESHDQIFLRAVPQLYASGEIPEDLPVPFYDRGKAVLFQGKQKQSLFKPFMSQMPEIDVVRLKDFMQPIDGAAYADCNGIQQVGSMRVSVNC